MTVNDPGAFQFRVRPEEMTPDAMLKLDPAEQAVRWAVFLRDIEDANFLVADPSTGGGGSVQAGTVTNAGLADMVQATVKGRASGAGTGDPTDLTASQVLAILLTDEALRASGTSTSTTPGTSVASLTAAASQKFIGWTVFAAQTVSNNTQLTVTITYSDATTTTISTTADTAQAVLGNAGGLLRTDAGAYSSLTANSTKDVTGIAVTTLGSGSGTRAAVISVIEIPQ